LSGGGLNEVLRLDGDRLRESAVFALEASDTSSLRDWALDVRDPRGEVLWSTKGQGAPPQACPWDGTGSGSSRLEGGNVYEYQLRVTYEDGLEIRGPRRAFGVDRGTSIAMTMTGDSFEAGRAVLTPAALVALAELAKALRRSPSEKVIVEGHTDSVGSPAGNLALSRARAEAAGSYLVELVRLPRLEILEPRGEMRIPYGGTAPGVTVGPRGAGSGPPQVAGLGAAPREQAAAHVLVSGRTDPGNRVEVDGVVVPVARAGEF